MAKKPIPQKPSLSNAVVSTSPASPGESTHAELPYAIIEHAANNSVLYPIDAIDGTTATLTLPAGSNDVVLYWAIKDQAEPTFSTLTVQSGNTVEIPWEYVSTSIGHTVLIWYTVRAGGRLQESLVLELEIQHVKEADLRESLPVFLHAKLEWSTLWLNMYEFVGDETIQIKAWPMIQAGQRLFVTVAGDQHQVPYQFTWVAFDHVVTAAEAHVAHVFEFKLSRGWMSRRQDYSALTIHMGVIWDATEPVLPVPDDPLYENPLPLNAQDFHLRPTTLLRVDPALDLSPAHLAESVEFNGEWVANPRNMVNGAHVIIAYDGIHAGDRVCPKFTGTPGPGSPPLECRTVQEGETSLEFWIPPSAISANFDGKITLDYGVTYNGTGPWGAPTREVQVLDIGELPVPQVEEATGGTLDLNTFDGDASAVVDTWDFIEPEQPCWLWVTGKLDDGTAYVFDFLEGEPVSPEWLASGVNTPLPRGELKKIADCSPIQVHFAVNFNGLADKASAKKFPLLTLDIVQEDLVLKAPSVREAVGSQLTIYNARDGVAVRVAYEGINPAHAISVCWKQANGSCLPLISKPGNTAPGYVDFHIPREAVIRAAGKTVTINYTVTSACKQATSDDLKLQISVPVRLPTPVVPQATPPATQGGNLDLRTFTGDAAIQVEKWWFLLLGQVGWMECAGTKEDGSAYVIKVMIREPLASGDLNGLSRVFQRAELEKLRDKSALTITFKATADDSILESDAIRFPVLSLTLRKKYRDFTDFDDRDWRGWAVGTGAPDPRDLSLEPQAVGFAVKNYTYSNHNIGPILQRTLSSLEAGRTYRFSVKVRRLNTANPTPKLSLRHNTVEKTAVMELVDLAWRTLSFMFVASSASELLDIYSHELDPDTSGNDYLMDDFLIEEV